MIMNKSLFSSNIDIRKNAYLNGRTHRNNPTHNFERGETEGQAAAGRPWRGRPGPVAAPCGHGRAAARADAGGEPGGRVGGRAAHGVTGEEGLVARVARGRRHATAPMGAGSPGRPRTCFATSGGGTTSGPTPPNGRWVTDAAGSRAPAGRARPSPIAGRLDGMPPGRAVPASPDAEMANPSLLGACEWLREGDRTAARPDGGSHYRWPGWIGICEADSLAGSMPGRGRGPGNARCEGLFGRLKIEFSYGCDWSGAATGGLAGMLDVYLRWHGDAGTRGDPGHGGPTRHGRDLGSAARTWARRQGTSRTTTRTTRSRCASGRQASRARRPSTPRCPRVGRSGEATRAPGRRSARAWDSGRRQGRGSTY